MSEMNQRRSDSTLGLVVVFAVMMVSVYVMVSKRRVREPTVRAILSPSSSPSSVAEFRRPSSLPSASASASAFPCAFSRIEPGTAFQGDEEKNDDDDGNRRHDLEIGGRWTLARPRSPAGDVRDDDGSDERSVLVMMVVGTYSSTSADDATQYYVGVDVDDECPHHDDDDDDQQTDGSRGGKALLVDDCDPSEIGRYFFSESGVCRYELRICCGDEIPLSTSPTFEPSTFHNESSSTTSTSPSVRV